MILALAGAGKNTKNVVVNFCSTKDSFSRYKRGRPCIYKRDIKMNNFPHISEYSPQKISRVFKQTKTKKQHLKQPQTQEQEETDNDKAPSEKNENTNSLLDVYA